MPHPLFARRPGRVRRSALGYLLVGLAAFVLTALLSALLQPSPGLPDQSPVVLASPTAEVVASRVRAEGKLPTPSGMPVAATPVSTPSAVRATSQRPSRPPVTPRSSPTAGRTETDDLRALPSPTGTSSHTVLPHTPTPALEPTLNVAYYGVAMTRADEEHGLGQARQAGIGVIRVSELNWDYVEPVRTDPPTYLWDKMSDLDQELVNASQAGIQVTLLVLYTPLWARQVPTRACSSIKDEALDEYAQFLQAAVARYGQPPYNIHDWELYNEPDVDPSLVGTYSGIGCWGDAHDPFYGGRSYGRMLQTVYPAIKQVDPTARIILGGLLLDKPDIPSSAFLSGVLEAGAGDSFDILAYHAYTYYLNPDIPESDRHADMPWSSRGGVVAGKAQFLRDVAAQYGITKPLMLNEAGLGWYGAKSPPGEFPTAQGDYVTKLYVRGRALDLVGVIWYGWDAPGWRHMALLWPGLWPRPGASALAQATQQVGSAQYTGATAYEGLEGYAFRREFDRLEVVWSADRNAHTVHIPLAKLRKAFDGVGELVSYSEDGGQAVFTVVRPTYLVLAP